MRNGEWQRTVTPSIGAPFFIHSLISELFQTRYLSQWFLIPCERGGYGQTQKDPKIQIFLWARLGPSSVTIQKYLALDLL